MFLLDMMFAPIRFAVGIPIAVVEKLTYNVTKEEKYGGPSDVSVYDLAEPNLDLCSMIYFYTELRSETKKLIKKFADEKGLSTESKSTPSDLEILYNAINEVETRFEQLKVSSNPTVALSKYKDSEKQLENLSTKFNITEGDVKVFTQYFKIISTKPKSNTDIKRDLRLFYEYISPQFRLGFGGTEFNIKNVEDLVELDEDSYVYYIDDDFTKTSMDLGFINGLDSEIVYAIVISDKNKTISVVFRGSVNANDWITNIQCGSVECKFPGFTTERGMETTDRQTFGRVHEGFYKYLCGETQEGRNGSSKSKGEEIIGMLKALVNGEKKGYSIIITGHSLGGALSTLMSARAVALNDFDAPILNVSFASPFVGDQVFRDHFYDWEKMNRVKHLRVANYEDVVPLIPVCTFPGADFHFYKHTGMHVKLFNKSLLHHYTYQLAYPKKDCLVNEVRNSVHSNLFNGVNINMLNHLCPEYEKRLSAAKDDLEKVNLWDLYLNNHKTGWTYEKNAITTHTEESPEEEGKE